MRWRDMTWASQIIFWGQQPQSRLGLVQARFIDKSLRTVRLVHFLQSRIYKSFCPHEPLVGVIIVWLSLYDCRPNSNENTIEYAVVWGGGTSKYTFLQRIDKVLRPSAKVVEWARGCRAFEGMLCGVVLCCVVLCVRWAIFGMLRMKSMSGHGQISHLNNDRPATVAPSSHWG